MTAPHFAWAIREGRRRRLPPSARLVLIALAERCNPDRVCWPSLATIADDTGLSERTAFTMVHRLDEMGVLRISKRGYSLCYRLNRAVDREMSDLGSPEQIEFPIYQDDPEENEPLQPLQSAESAAPEVSCKSCDPPVAMVAKKPSIESPKEERGSLRSQGDPDLFSSDIPAENVPPEVPPDEPDPVLELADAWNRMAAENDLPKVILMTPARRRSLAARVAEVGWDSMQRAIGIVAGSAFCRGVNDTGWRADFDFILQPKSLIRLLEGRYTRGDRHKPGKLDYLVRMMAGEMPEMSL